MTRMKLFGFAIAIICTFAIGCTKTISTRSVQDGFGLCKALAPDEGSACVGAALSFESTDPAVVYRMEFEHVSRPVVLECVWFDPSGSEFMRSGPIRLTAESYRERAVVGCRLPIAGHPPSIYPGRWTLQVYYDGGENTRNYRGGLLREVEIPIG